MKRFHKLSKENFFLLLALLLTSAISIVLYRNYLPDDLFIHLRYAQNLFLGHGWSFNPNEPSYGTTSPLWIILLSLTSFLSKNLILNAKLLGLIFMWCSLVMFNSLSRPILKEQKFVNLATLIFALDPWFTRWSISGMEVPLTTFLILLGFYLLLFDRTGKYRFAVPLTFGLATLCRPECGMLIILLLLHELLASGLRLKTIKMMVRDSFLFFLVYAPWLFYAKVTFGTIIPNTALAKAFAKPIFSEYFVILKEIGAVLFAGYFIEALFIFYGLILISLNLKRNWADILADIKRYFAIYSWILAVPIFYLVQTVYTGGRYMLIVTVLLVIMGFKALKFILTKVHSVNTNRKIFKFIVVLLLLQLILLTAFLYPWARDGGIISIREVYIYIGKWLSQNTPQDATVAIFDIGAVGYYSNRKIIDLAGLINPEALKYKRRFEFLIRSKPDYYVGAESSPMKAMQDERVNRYLNPIFTRHHRGYGPGKPQDFFVTVYKCNFE